MRHKFVGSSDISGPNLSRGGATATPRCCPLVSWVPKWEVSVDVCALGLGQGSRLPDEPRVSPWAV